MGQMGEFDIFVKGGGNNWAGTDASNPLSSPRDLRMFLSGTGSGAETTVWVRTRTAVSSVRKMRIRTRFRVDVFGGTSAIYNDFGFFAHGIDMNSSETSWRGFVLQFSSNPDFRNRVLLGNISSSTIVPNGSMLSNVTDLGQKEVYDFTELPVTLETGVTYAAELEVQHEAGPDETRAIGRFASDGTFGSLSKVIDVNVPSPIGAGSDPIMAGMYGHAHDSSGGASTTLDMIWDSLEIWGE